MEPSAGDPDDAALQADRTARAEQMWADLRAIRTPTLLMRGEMSKILSHEAAEHAVEAMPDARLVVIPRATHNVHSDNPGDFARELDTFFTQVLSARE